MKGRGKGGKGRKGDTRREHRVAGRDERGGTVDARYARGRGGRKERGGKEYRRRWLRCRKERQRERGGCGGQG